MMNDAMRPHSIVLALAFTLAPVYAQQPFNPPLKNWPAPLYWAAMPREAEQQRIEQRIAHPDVSSSAIAQAASLFTPPGPMTFIAVTPCRVMDTRSTQGFTGAFGPPSLAANVARQVPMPTSTTCSVSSLAGAYSLNITVVPPGPLSFLSVWPAGAPYPGVSTLNDPVSGGVIANAAIIVTGTSGAIQMLASNNTDVIIDINGYYVAPTDGGFNTSIGAGALTNNTTGYFNTASGWRALVSNTSGSNNTASGTNALAFNTTGSSNTASGEGALEFNTTGSFNTASGVGALQLNGTGSYNTATGYLALQQNILGFSNTASGAYALENSNGSDNTAGGYQALQSDTTGSYNTSMGYQTMQANTIGNFNAAYGFGVLQENTIGSYNTAIGISTLADNTTGNYNTAIGSGALDFNTTGIKNIAIGVGAADSVSGANSNNIHIGNVWRLRRRRRRQQRRHPDRYRGNADFVFRGRR